MCENEETTNISTTFACENLHCKVIGCEKRVDPRNYYKVSARAIQQLVKDGTVKNPSQRILVCQECFRGGEEIADESKLKVDISDDGDYLIKEEEFDKEDFAHKLCGVAKGLESEVTRLEASLTMFETYVNYLDPSKPFPVIWDGCRQESDSCSASSSEELALDFTGVPYSYTIEQIECSDLSKLMQEEVEAKLVDYCSSNGITSPAMQIQELSSGMQTLKAGPNMKKHLEGLNKSRKAENQDPYPVEWEFMERSFKGLIQDAESKRYFPVSNLVVQEYPSTSTIWIGYADLLQIFEPAAFRSDFLKQVVIAYLRCMRNHFKKLCVWVSPPRPGDEYVWGPKNYDEDVEWYKDMLNTCKNENIIQDYQQPSGTCNPYGSYIEIPYLQEDFWAKKFEEILEAKRPTSSQPLDVQACVFHEMTKLKGRLFVADFKTKTPPADEVQESSVDVILRKFLQSIDLPCFWDGEEKGMDHSDKRPGTPAVPEAEPLLPLSQVESLDSDDSNDVRQQRKRKRKRISSNSSLSDGSDKCSKSDSDDLSIDGSDYPSNVDSDDDSSNNDSYESLNNDATINKNAAKPKRVLRHNTPRKRKTCEVCYKKVFNMKPHLQTHGIKTQDEPCRYCGKLFASRGNRIQHELGHVKPIKCDQINCDYPCRYKSELKIHLFRKHGIGFIEMKKCKTPGCNKEYDTTGGLTRHCRMEGHTKK